MRNSIIVIAVTAAASLMIFQNCGRGLKASSVAGDSQAGLSNTPPPSGGTLPLPSPGGATFAAGDAFNYNSVAVKSQMIQTQIELLGYTAYAGFKAIAVNSSGLGYVTRGASGTQADLNRQALEGCYTLGGGSPCALLATGDKFAIGSADLPASYSFVMTAPSAINGATIPWVQPNLRNGLAQLYNDASSPKAIALSVDGSYVFVTGSDSTPITSIAEARRVALERCELNASISPCTLFAENSTVVFNPASINRTPVIDYARTSLMTNVPGLKDAHFNAIIVPYLNAVDGISTHGAIYLAGDGAGGFAYHPSATTADTNAKSLCEANVNTGFGCFRYATDKSVQSVAAGLAAAKNFPGTHCKTVPRVSCAAHQAMGCAAGSSYYVMDGATPKLQPCL